MSDKLNDIFNIADETTKAIEEKKDIIVSDNLPVVPQSFDSLADISGHERDMDTLAEQAMAGYEEIMEFARESEERNVAAILASATSMMKNAIDAKESKMRAKLQASQIMLRKMAADEKKELKNADVVDQDNEDEDFLSGDRNKILGVINNLENNK